MSLLDNAKTLRRNLTDAEQEPWYHLRAHRAGAGRGQLYWWMRCAYPPYGIFGERDGVFVGWISAAHPPTYP
jgi:hypothetical protein